MLPATPQISLAKEHCSYFGAYCKSGDSKEKSDTLDVFDDPQETNGSKVFGDRSHTGFPSDSFLGSIPATGLIKVSVEFLTFYVYFMDFIVFLHWLSPQYSILYMYVNSFDKEHFLIYW